MNTLDIDSILKQRFDVKHVIKSEVIQNLWSGYGEIARYELHGSETHSIILKHIRLEQAKQHPRGWNTDMSHERKVKSYQVEVEWYKEWAHKCGDNCRVPICYESYCHDQVQLIILEDLDASGFSIRKSSLSIEEVKVGLAWLANFHARFLNEVPNGLWSNGTYWHIDTRPDEWKAMNDGMLKQKAFEIDQKLNNSQFQTIVHGDAKVANFCFSEDMKSLAAVDFQYVGGGCGMKDVAYFLGSCLDENDCDSFENELLNYYFDELEKTLSDLGKPILIKELEEEWRRLYVFAWADFSRFLLGWMPTHQKLNAYSRMMVEKTLNLLA